MVEAKISDLATTLITVFLTLLAVGSITTVAVLLIPAKLDGLLAPILFVAIALFIGFVLV